MNLCVYIEKVAMVINGACMESQYFRIRRFYIKRFPTFLGSHTYDLLTPIDLPSSFLCQDEWLMRCVEAASSRIFPGKRVHV